MVCECLRATGHLGKADLSAQGIYDYLKSKGWLQCDPANIPDSAILFFGSDITDIRHVAIALANRDMVEAAGGDDTCKTVEEAAKQGAFQRVRPIFWRKDFVAALKIGGIK